MNVIKSFGGTEVAFDSFKTVGDLMVNATQMAKIFGKEVSGFLKTESTKKFVEAYCRAEDLPSQEEFSPNGKIIKVISNGRNNGTWMNRVAAIKFAAWLNPDFEVWVYKTIDEIMFGFAREQDSSIHRTVLIKQELSGLEKKIDKSGEDFERYMDLKNQLTYEQTVRAGTTRRRFREIYAAIKENEVSAN